MKPLITRLVSGQKFVFQCIALITLAVAVMLFWNVLPSQPQDVRSRATESAPLAQVNENGESSAVDVSYFLSLMLPISLLAILLGIACAFYLEEWLAATSWIRRLIESHVALLNGIPSLLYGLLAIVLLFAYAGPLSNASSSGDVFYRHSTFLFYAGALTFVLLVMPVAIQTTQEALRSVAGPIRESAYALGANRWQVLANPIVPLALPCIVAGGCRAMSRAFAAAAVLIGIQTWGYTTISGGGGGRFILLLGGALLLSVFSGFLMESRRTL